MGNAQSNDRLFQRIESIIPASESKKWEMFDKSHKPFAGQKDREQFIYAVTTVLTQNGALLLGDHEIRLLYSRRANDRIVARIVAEKEGVVVTKIEPSDDGKDQVEAFMALRRDIEVRLDRILSMVPGEVHAPVPSSPASAREGPSVRRAPVERPIPNLPESSRQQEGFGSGAAPPPYGSAVKEWRNDEKKG